MTPVAPAAVRGGVAGPNDRVSDALAAWPTPTGEAVWADLARARAELRLRAAGLPTRRDEYWRFADPAPLTAPFAPDVALASGEMSVGAGVLSGVECGFGAPSLKLVFVDGGFRPDLSDPAAFDAGMLDGLEITPLAAALGADASWAQQDFGTLEARGQTQVARPLAALNTARATEGLAIRVTGRIATPVEIVYARSAARSDALVHHLVRMEPGAELTLLESGCGAARLNLLIEAKLGDGASLRHLRLRGAHEERDPSGDGGNVAAMALFASLGRDARLRSFCLVAGGRLIRNEAVVELAGEAASVHLAAASIGQDFGTFSTIQDDTVFIAHAAGGCESRQVIRKVLSGGAVGIFQGKILVGPAGQKTDGYQIARGMLRDEASSFLVKPELEIRADDVSCSHGATAGGVDEAQAFYLASRGIPRAEAEDMLARAFLEEAITEVEDGTPLGANLAQAARRYAAAWLR